VSEREFLTVAEIAARTGLSRSAVYRAVDDGELEAHKIRGRVKVRVAAYEAWLESCQVRRERRGPRSFERAMPARRPSGTFAAKLANRRAA